MSAYFGKEQIFWGISGHFGSLWGVSKNLFIILGKCKNCKKEVSYLTNDLYTYSKMKIRTKIFFSINFLKAPPYYDYDIEFWQGHITLYCMFLDCSKRHLALLFQPEVTLTFDKPIWHLLHFKIFGIYGKFTLLFLKHLFRVFQKNVIFFNLECCQL